MSRHVRRAIITIAIVLAGSACGAGGPTASTLPRAQSFEEYAAAFCSAFESLFRGVGNPDTGSGSALSQSLDAAVEAGDVASAERLAASITAELENGRQFVNVAGGWQPAEPGMANLDRVFVAFEAMIAAKRSAATHAPDAAVPQTAFERAGGVEAWFAMLEANRSMTRPPGAAGKPCATVPIGP
jgi:hypothetical protein